MCHTHWLKSSACHFSSSRHVAHVSFSLILFDLPFYFRLNFPVFFLSCVLMHTDLHTDLDNLDPVENNPRHSAKGSLDAYDVAFSLTRNGKFRKVKNPELSKAWRENTTRSQCYHPAQNWPLPLTSTERSVHNLSISFVSVTSSLHVLLFKIIESFMSSPESWSSERLSSTWISLLVFYTSSRFFFLLLPVPEARGKPTQLRQRDYELHQRVLRPDRMQSSFKIDLQLILFQKLLDW